MITGGLHGSPKPIFNCHLSGPGSKVSLFTLDALRVVILLCMARKWAGGAFEASGFGAALRVQWLQAVGAKHTVYHNPANQRTSTVPRHREVKNPTAVRICKDLGVPNPIR